MKLLSIPFVIVLAFLASDAQAIGLFTENGIPSTGHPFVSASHYQAQRVYNAGFGNHGHHGYSSDCGCNQAPACGCGGHKARSIWSGFCHKKHQGCGCGHHSLFSGLKHCCDKLKSCCTPKCGCGEPVATCGCKKKCHKSLFSHFKGHFHGCRKPANDCGCGEGHEVTEAYSDEVEMNVESNDIPLPPPVEGPAA